MTWRAHVHHNVMMNRYELLLARDITDTDQEIVVGAADGLPTTRRGHRHTTVPPFVALDRGAFEALQQAINEAAPRPSDADLREALTVERMRVDRVLDRLIPEA